MFTRFHFIVRKLPLSIFFVFLGAIISAFAGDSETQSQEDETSRDLFYYETTYTLPGDFRGPRLGDGDSLYNDFSYDHRFHITGNWYLRTGFEYERFDFAGSNNGLPNHLQAVYGHVAAEYVVKDYAAAGLQLEPGVYFQDNISGDAFDIPWKFWVTFPLKKDKIFGVIGLGGAIYQDPIVAPGGGIIWLINDKLRLQGVFPKPALIYNATDDWEFRVQGEILYGSFRTDDLLTPKYELHNAVLQYGEQRAGFQARFSGFEPFRLVAGAGYTFKRDFDFYRAERREKVDPAPYFRVSVEAKF